MAATRAASLPKAAPVDELRNALKAALFGANRVMLVRPAKAASYGWKKVVRLDSWGMLARVVNSELFVEFWL